MQTFKSNAGLKSLSFDKKYLFLVDFSQKINFKLTEFSLDFLPEGRFLDHFSLFLRTQKDSLEKITIEGWMGVEIMKTIFSMPRLKKFKLKNMDHSSIDYTEYAADSFPQNSSVTSLILGNTSIRTDLVLLILKAFPKIEFLEISRMDDSIADFIPENLKFLDHLSVSSFRVKNFSNRRFYLTVLKSFNCSYRYILGEPQCKKLRIN